MRDVGLARRQLLGGLFGLVAAGVLLVLVVWPQYNAWQELKTQKNGLSSHRPDSLSVLPDLSVLGEKRFRKESTARWADLCQQHGFTVQRIDLGETHPNMYSNMPAGVQELVFSIRGQGSRADLKALLQALSETTPGLQLGKVEIMSVKPVGATAKVTTPAPVKVQIRGMVLLWKPDL